MRHFLSELDLTAAEFRSIIERGSELRKQWESHTGQTTLPQYVLAMIFEKSSTRTRVSFEAGIVQLGGHAIYLSPNDTQLGRGEPLSDTARVLSQMVDIICVRTFSQDALERFSEVCTVPVINALTDLLHPCQLLADMQTFFDHRGDISGKRVAWIGDGNNMCNSYINTAKLLNFHLCYACPDGYEPNLEIVERAGENTSRASSPAEACEKADLIVTDVWASMGQEEEQKQREQVFSDYEVTEELMALANEDALFMHCLPAHRGEEVSAEVIDGPQSVVWEEAGNRLHAQKALLEFLLLP
ncbi:MAG: ornithine carbamoyltransferase [Granulosicoccus sp.]|nr:ornithine carbamoyltransferase [Granulosicoccus sp.]